MDTLSLTKGARIHNGKETRFHNAGKTVSSTNGVGKTGQPHVKKKKMKSYHSLTP